MATGSRAVTGTAARALLAAGGVALVFGGGYVLGAELLESADPVPGSGRGIPVGVIATGAIIIGGAMLGAVAAALRR